MKTQRLEWLEAMRGFAAIWVVLYHANQGVTAFLRPAEHAQLVRNGFVGVTFFFILSGFIIASSSQQLIEQGKGMQAYLQARLVRIYVPYLPIGVGLFFLYLLLPSLSAGQRSISMLTSFTLLPANGPPALSVAWTLVHEMIFYAVFSLIFVSRRLLWAMLACWVVAILATAYVGAELSRFASYFLGPINLCFLLGISLFYFSRCKLPSWAAGLATAVGLSAVLWTASYAAPNGLVIAAGFALLIAAAASPYGERMKVWRVATKLGAASYAIYLVHNPLISVAVRALRFVDPAFNPWIGLLAISIFTIVAGLLYWFFYERVALRFVRTKLNASASAQHRAGLAGEA